MPTYHRVRLQPSKTLNNRQVAFRGRLRIQPIVTIGHSSSTTPRAHQFGRKSRVTHLKKVHEDTRNTIERQVQHLATKLNINKQPMVFNTGDLVWLHLRKERFPQERKSKLRPRADGPFKVLARYNDNAYKIDLPRDKYNVSDILTPRDRCARCLPVIRYRCHVICLRVGSCHVIMCIASSCFQNLHPSGSPRSFRCPF